VQRDFWDMKMENGNWISGNGYQGMEIGEWRPETRDQKSETGKK
jgi:hypothetical protein